MAIALRFYVTKPQSSMNPKPNALTVMTVVSKRRRQIIRKSSSSCSDCVGSCLSDWTIQEFEMLNGNLAVEHRSVEPGFSWWKHNHEVRVCRELEDEEAESGTGLVLHPDELLGVAGCSCESGDALLEVLHDVGHAL